MTSQASSLVDNVASARSRDALELAFSQFANAFNAKFFAFTVAASIKLDGVGNFPKDFQDRYVTEEYVRYDPVVATAKRVRRPFRWSIKRLHCACMREREILREVEGFGVCSGASFPVDLPYGTFALLTLTTNSNFNGLDLKKYAAACAVAMSMGQRVLRDTVAGDIKNNTIGLTNRQLQCLVWASKGRSANETSCILGISESSVSFHIKEARKRLGAKNISEAIKLACELKLLS